MFGLVSLSFIMKIDRNETLYFSAREPEIEFDDGVLYIEKYCNIKLNSKLKAQVYAITIAMIWAFSLLYFG